MNIGHERCTAQRRQGAEGHGMKKQSPHNPRAQSPLRSPSSISMTRVTMRASRTGAGTAIGETRPLRPCGAQCGDESEPSRLRCVQRLCQAYRLPRARPPHGLRDAAGRTVGTRHAGSAARICRLSGHRFLLCSRSHTPERPECAAWVKSTAGRRGVLGRHTHSPSLTTHPEPLSLPFFLSDTGFS